MSIAQEAKLETIPLCRRLAVDIGLTMKSGLFCRNRPLFLFVKMLYNNKSNNANLRINVS
jgi:hypothetical protein